MAESAVKRRMSKIALDEGALTSDDPQAQVASRGWAQIAELPLVKKALDFQGNLKEYDDIVTRAMPSLDRKTGAFKPGNQEAGVELAERALGTVTATIGDWKKAGVKFSHVTNDAIHEVNAFDKSGNIVGNAVFDKTAKGIIPQSVEVNPANQRKGIASEMYKQAEEQTGSKVLPSIDRSDEAEALWKSPNRPFGTENPEGDLADRIRVARQETIDRELKSMTPETKKYWDDLTKVKADKDALENAKYKKVYEDNKFGGTNFSTTYVGETNPEYIELKKQQEILARRLAKPESAPQDLPEGKLPMDEASRMKRAKDMGFDTEKMQYHGTAADIEEFNPNFNKKAANRFLPGVYTSNNPSLASGYSMQSKGSNVMPVLTKTEGFINLEEPKSLDLVYDQLGINKSKPDRYMAKRIESTPEIGNVELLTKSYADHHDISLEKAAKALPKELTKLGINGFDIPSYQVRNTFSPSNIRSQFAEFNPKKAKSGKISAGLAGAGLVGAASQGDDGAMKRRLHNQGDN